jgi:hypothetical protein
VKKVLLIYDSFPPEKSSGIGRPLSLYRHLAESGIDATVLTKKDYGKVPGEKGVFRAESLDIWQKYRHRIGIKLLSWAAFRLGTVSNDLLFYFRARRLLKRLVNEGVDIIYASFPYTNPLLLALFAKEHFGIPFIAEFRDGYLFEPLFEKNWFQARSARSFERRIVRESECVVTIGKNLSAYFQSAYPAKDCHTIYNGYSKMDIPKIRKKTDLGTQVVIGYFGSFLLLRNKKHGIGNLLRGMRAAVLESRRAPGELRFEFIGNFIDSEKDAFAKAGLGDFVEFKPYMDRETGFAYMVNSVDYLLFVGVDGGTTVVSAKLPEYLLLGKPILGICEGNEAENVIRDTGTGEVCGFGADEIRALLLKAISGTVRYEPMPEAIRGFDRQVQAKAIASIIHETLARSEAGGGT